MVLDIVSYPDKRLFQRSKEVEVFDEKLHKFLDDMFDTMIAKNGIGLAAVQVGVLERIAIMNVVNKGETQERNKTIEIINPEIIFKDDETVYEEGCLSVPGFYDEVKRAKILTLKFQDRFGNFKELKADGLLAICAQHELDHLNGHLFIEKITYKARKRFEKEFKKKK